MHTQRLNRIPRVPRQRLGWLQAIGRWLNKRVLRTRVAQLDRLIESVEHEIALCMAAKAVARLRYERTPTLDQRMRDLEQGRRRHLLDRSLLECDLAELEAQA